MLRSAARAGAALNHGDDVGDSRCGHGEGWDSRKGGLETSMRRASSSRSSRLCDTLPAHDPRPDPPTLQLYPPWVQNYRKRL